MQFFSNSTNNSIQSIRKFIMNYDQNFNINNCALNNYSKNEIISFYNGIFQSEGGVLVEIYKKKLPDGSLKIWLGYSISIFQLYSLESLEVFTFLKHYLKTGNLYLSSSNNKPYLKFKIKNYNDITSKAIPFFSELYGNKKLGLMLIPIIHELFFKYNLSLQNKTVNCLSNNQQLLVDLIHLIYLTNSQGKRRKISEDALLKDLNINTSKFSPSPDSSLFKFIENNSVPSELFLVGFYLGDGSIGCFLRDLRPKKNSISIELSFLLEQSYSSANQHLINLFSKIFPEVSNVFFSNSIARLSIIGFNIYSSVYPVLKKHYNILYWKKIQFNMLNDIFFIWKPNCSLTKSTLLKILDIIYNPLLNFKVSKKLSKEHFFNIIQLIYGESETKLTTSNTSGYKNTYRCDNKNKGVIIGYRVAVPINGKIVKKNFSWKDTSEESIKSTLNKAIVWRDEMLNKKEN
jgi:hypothetical protein